MGIGGGFVGDVKRSGPGAPRLAGAMVTAIALALSPVARADGPSMSIWSFHSVAFHPPRVTMREETDPAAGSIFLSPSSSYRRRTMADAGPMIVNPWGRLVWFDPLTDVAPKGRGQAANLDVQSYRGQPVLTWWQGSTTGGLGEDVIMDRSYRIVAVLRGQGHPLDSHEFQITPQGTALVDAYIPVKADLTSVGGPADGTVLDCVIQEQDIQTHQVLWEWHSLAHVPITDSHYPFTGSEPYGYFHLNSIQQLPSGDLLISARHTWAVYLIDKRTGRIKWTLGGRHSSFTVGPAARFEWQHDAHLVGHRLTLFDNGADGPSQPEPDSSAKVLWLDTRTWTASLIHAYHHTPRLLSVSQGSVQMLPDGNVFVGWGSQPRFSEFAPGGQQIVRGGLPLGIGSYRAFRFRWSAQPLTRPALAVSATTPGLVALYASWNGATDVAKWRVLGGPEPNLLAPLGRDPRTNFETAISLRSSLQYFAVQALNAAGQVLATSGPVAR